MDVVTLNNEINKVCPTTTTRIFDPNDRTTWSFDPGEGATQAQIDAGNNVIATISYDLKTLSQPKAETSAIYAHENRLRTLEGQPPLSLGDFLTKFGL